MYIETLHGEQETFAHRDSIRINEHWKSKWGSYGNYGSLS